MSFLFSRKALFNTHLIFPLVFIFLVFQSLQLYSQNGGSTGVNEDVEALEVPEKIEVKPLTRDYEISERLQNILTETGWFENPDVEVRGGVVFLRGHTKNAEYKKWAGDLARRTQDVAAVVNQIEIKPSIWDYSQALNGLRTLWRRVVQALPSIFFGLIILSVAWVAALLVAAGARVLLRKRVENPLLRDVAARAIGFLVFLIGVYIVFEVAGLTTVALTVVGGTGLLGIILGIAFRAITENILASIFLSVQHPFRNGDLIEIEGITGYVQRLTLRATVLMSLEGNHIQIPNSVIYKSKIRNYTSNPKRREEFVVGISYDDEIPKAQEVALQVLTTHPAVLKVPEPWVLVDSLGQAVVNLRIYFWLDGNEHSWLKVKSSVIRLIKRAFQDNDITMPDEARELIFPKGISVNIEQPQEEKRLDSSKKSKSKEIIATNAETGLQSQAKEIQDQALQARIPESGENLLKSDPPQKSVR